MKRPNLTASTESVQPMSSVEPSRLTAMAGETNKRLVWTGPAQQVCYPLGDYGYSPSLVPDTPYELPVEFADALLRSSVHWAEAKASFHKASRTEEAAVTSEPEDQESE